MGAKLKRLFSSFSLGLGHEPSSSPLHHVATEPHVQNQWSTILWRGHERMFHLSARSIGHGIAVAHNNNHLVHFAGLRRHGWDAHNKTRLYSQARGQFCGALRGKVAAQGQRVYDGTSPFSARFGVMIGVASFTCARHHFVLPILALAFGVNGSVAEAADYSRGSSISLQKPSQYSLVSLVSFLLSVIESLSLCFRALHLLLLFTPAIAGYPLVGAFGGRYRQAWLRTVRYSLELAGAAFIKWGQWAATRPDLFPRDLCAELSKLHMEAPSHSFAYTKRTVEGAFGRKLGDIFEDFEEEPIASGSIAQVHRAVLRYRHPGQKSKPMLVAVKVRHPGVGNIIKRDFLIIHWIASMSKLVPALRWLRLEESVQQFAVFMLTQVDLSREAAHLNRFIYNFRRWKDVSFPKPLYPLVHPAVLVETFEQGESVSRFVEHSPGENRINSILANIGTHSLLKMLLVDNFIHADMHPGNILVRVVKKKRPSGRRSLRPHLVFLDVGMTAELSRKDRMNLLEFFKAVAVRDGRTAAKCCLEFSKAQSCPDPEAFTKEVETSFTFWGTEEGDAVHPAECMEDLLDQVRRHKVNIDGNVCTVLVTILVLEGWQRRLDPHYNIMKTLQTLLFKADWAKSLSYTIEGIMAP